MLTRRIGNPGRNPCPIEDPHLFSNVWCTDSICECHKNRAHTVTRFIASGGTLVSDRVCKHRVESLQVLDPKDIPPEAKHKAIGRCTPSETQKAKDTNWQSGEISSSPSIDIDDSMDSGFKLGSGNNACHEDGPVATSSPRSDSPWSYFNPISCLMVLLPTMPVRPPQIVGTLKWTAMPHLTKLR